MNRTLAFAMVPAVALASAVVMPGCATGPGLQTARVIEPDQKTLGIGFTQVKLPTGDFDETTLATLTADVPEKPTLNLLGLTGRRSFFAGVDFGVVLSGALRTDESLGGESFVPSSFDAKLRLVDVGWFQSSFDLGVGVAKFQHRIATDRQTDQETGLGSDDESDEDPEIEFEHSEANFHVLNSFAFGAFGLHVNPGIKYGVTKVVYRGPLKEQTTRGRQSVTLYSRQGALRGGSLGLSLSALDSMKLMVMAGQYLDQSGAIAESYLSIGLAEIMTDNMAAGKSRGSKSAGMSSVRDNGSFLVKAGFGGAEAALAVPTGDELTVGIAAQSYKRNPLKHGGASLSEDAMRSDSGSGGALFSEWFPWRSQGSVYFRSGLSYLRYPDGLALLGVDLGFGERWSIGNLAVDVGWLQLSAPALVVKRSDGETSRKPLAVRTPSVGIGFAF